MLPSEKHLDYLWNPWPLLPKTNNNLKSHSALFLSASDFCFRATLNKVVNPQMVRYGLVMSWRLVQGFTLPLDPPQRQNEYEIQHLKYEISLV